MSSSSTRLEKMPARPGHMRGPPTPSMTTPAADFDQQLTASPPPPPTPAASPGPSHHELDWSHAADDEDFFLAKVRHHFKNSGGPHRTRLLADLLNLCTSQQLSFVHQFVSPLLKKDPFTSLPDELCLRILSFIDDPKVLARASQVSRRWRDLLSDDMTWKNLCVKHDYGRRLSEVSVPMGSASRPGAQPLWGDNEYASSSFPGALPMTAHASGSRSLDGANTRPKMRSYKSHFKQRYLVEAAWRSGGTSTTRNITQEGGVVTSLHLTPKYIIVALDNAKIHVFDTKGNAQRTLQGHVMGVWAMVPWEDILVSGGCDRDVRVWNLATGNVLVGHGASVRCLEIKGDIVVSGSYDTMAKVWSISEGRCIQTLQGHFSQIYAIAFDGKRVVTGSLDTNVRIWDPRTAECLAILQGHTSLVGQLQMRGDTLVTGGSDGSFDDTRVVSGGSDGRVKIWDLKTGHLVRELIAQGEAVWRVAFEDEKCVALALRQNRTVMEVWSFSPPEDVLYDRPLSLQQRVLQETPNRPMSAMQLDFRQQQPTVAGPSREAAGSQDVDMRDAGPSTAPLQGGNKTFFHDD
ncbi:F-box/WD repeat-containing protein 7 [Colletotrichum sp. SAR 10_70]|nr:F-box/WD repeat-containing protein 7 [Colletotrichum sp. SAR 10_71]KAI8159173.1 F-box/WD repeat-containing protein 7 [Colletotrichum sp. SAR 10_70]KAI8177733.1 F-box/WD repeat-containing protein 7 [Colletotrichum sp. SAR 10_75]KAI8182843.1 F-box/WD repeat-containing protein 7 [Colletotrichum sp. SAR 10_65]KAI8201076.1 F-box/WD repeat-containing protein 7 [Colletotrichum sp. SAR 10_76]KAI8220955.1 F-box/WD repeat-containing protein 7 [Colletotrichum sp. SAR 10_77]KAI8222090.1 F-box/WD repea